VDRRAIGEALECLLLGRVVPQSDVSANERTPRYNPIYPSFRDLPMAWSGKQPARIRRRS